MHAFDDTGPPEKAAATPCSPPLPLPSLRRTTPRSQGLQRDCSHDLALPPPHFSVGVSAPDPSPPPPLATEVGPNAEGRLRDDLVRPSVDDGFVCMQALNSEPKASFGVIGSPPPSPSRSHEPLCVHRPILRAAARSDASAVFSPRNSTLASRGASGAHPS
jgi:hypothetical protein